MKSFRITGANRPPVSDSVSETTTKKKMAVPMMRLTMVRSPAPTCWAIRMLAAMVAPMIALSDRNITLLALPMAVMSVVPSRCATQNWLAVAFSDCSRLAPQQRQREHDQGAGDRPFDQLRIDPPAMAAAISARARRRTRRFGLTWRGARFWQSAVVHRSLAAAAEVRRIALRRQTMPRLKPLIRKCLIGHMPWR